MVPGEAAKDDAGLWDFARNTGVRCYTALGPVAWAGMRRPCSIRSCACAASSGCV